MKMKGGKGAVVRCCRVVRRAGTDDDATRRSSGTRSERARRKDDQSHCAVRAGRPPERRRDGRHAPGLGLHFKGSNL